MVSTLQEVEAFDRSFLCQNIALVNNSATLQVCNEVLKM